MQLPDARRVFSMRRATASIGLALVALAYLTGCGSGPPTTRFLLVSDSLNNRVLFYGYPLNTNESANGVLGQAGFTTSGPALTAATFNGPLNTAEDSAGNIYVSDFNNLRVLQFKPPFSNGMSASLVIGQPDFVTANPNTTQNGLGGPSGAGGPGGLAFDGNANLWVVDLGNNRIVQYKPPFSTSMNATLVIGQPDFTSRGIATTNSGLAGPHMIAFDASGDLWATDTSNNRVLEFRPPFANGMEASLVIGQADFVSRAFATTPTGLSFPTGIAFDTSGNLWVGDSGNDRVLQFKPPFANGMGASLVLGQPDFNSITLATTQRGFNGPFGIAFDGNGNLAVVDSSNHRTLIFMPPFSNYQDAAVVLGEADFTSREEATTATGEAAPYAVTAAF